MESICCQCGLRARVCTSWIENNPSRRFLGCPRYGLALPPPLSGVHDVFHISILRKYEPDPSHMLDWTELEMDEDVSYEERLVRILDTRDEVLRGKTIPLVKVLWRHHEVEEATWECKAEVREQYSNLFIDV